MSHCRSTRYYTVSQYLGFTQSYPGLERINRRDRGGNKEKWEKTQKQRKIMGDMERKRFI